MDLRAYYQKIRDIESKMADEFAVVVSLETADGGKAGAFTEVSRAIAAKMLVDGIALLAEAEEAAKFRAQRAEAAREAEQKAAALAPRRAPPLERRAHVAEMQIAGRARRKACHLRAARSSYG